MGNPGFMAPDTRTDAAGVPGPDQKNNADDLFVELVGEGGLAEVALGEIARQKAATPAVRQFAERMVAEHGAANDKLAGIAKAAGIAAPTDLAAEHAALRIDLEGTDAATFDLPYMRGQVVDHQKTAQLLEWEINSGQHAALQRFAAEILPAVLDHLAVARGIVEELSREQVAALPPQPGSP
jgi:putative membrane protein